MNVGGVPVHEGTQPCIQRTPVVCPPELCGYPIQEAVKSCFLALSYLLRTSCFVVIGS